MGLSSPPPGECCAGPFRARGHTAVHIALCICRGLVSVSRVCVHTWAVTLQGVIAHVRACVYQCRRREVYAAHVVTYDVCAFTWSGEKPHPTSFQEEQEAEEARLPDAVPGQGLQLVAGLSPEPLFHPSGNRLCWLERNPTLEGIRRGLCLGPPGWPPRKVLGPVYRWDGIIFECPMGTGSSLPHRQAAVGGLRVATPETRVDSLM